MWLSSPRLFSHFSYKCFTLHIENSALQLVRFLKIACNSLCFLCLKWVKYLNWKLAPENYSNPIWLKLKNQFPIHYSVFADQRTYPSRANTRHSTTVDIQLKAAGFLICGSHSLNWPITILKYVIWYSIHLWLVKSNNANQVFRTLVEALWLAKGQTCTSSLCFLHFRVYASLIFAQHFAIKLRYRSLAFLKIKTKQKQMT